MAHLKFYLRPTTEKGIGVLCHYLLEGQKVLQRKSYKIRVPIKNWDNLNGKMKNSHPDSISINSIIKQAIEQFEMDTFSDKIGSIDEQCVLKMMQKRLDNRVQMGLGYGTKIKYQRIIKNYEEISMKLYGKKYIPIKSLRDTQVVNSVKNELINSKRTINGKKKFKSLKIYLYQLISVVEEWNATSGTQHPINISPIKKHLGKDSQQISRAVTKEEFELIKNYQTKGYRGAMVEIIAKSLFQFQYWCGGLRIYDTLLLTNKSYHKDKAELEIGIKKTKKVLYNPVSYQLAKSIDSLYPELFNKVESEVILSMAEIKLNTLTELSKVKYPKPIRTWNLSDVLQIEYVILKEDMVTYQKFKPNIDEIKNRLEQLIAERFFEELSQGEEHFIFPYLDIKDFDDTGLDTSRFSDEVESKIQRIRAKHNVALKRICEKLGIESISSHTSRHSIARHMIESGLDIYTIQGMLGHTNVSTTEVYIKSRHPFVKRGENLKKMYEKLK